MTEAGPEVVLTNIMWNLEPMFQEMMEQTLDGSFDNDSDTNIFKATFGTSFGSLTFGPVAQVGLSQELVAGDLTVVGSLEGGGELGPVDLVYIPEPSALILLSLGFAGLATTRVRRWFR